MGIEAGLIGRWFAWMRPVDTLGKTTSAVASVVLGILAISIAAAAALRCLVGGDIAAWTQAVGAILAIVSGFVVAFYQRSEERNDASLEALAIVQACYLLGFQALETVGERLENILTPSGIKFSLQGDRTSEMVEAMREFDTSRVPAEILKDFILLRSHVFAINKRISEIYDSKVDRNGDKNTSRHDRLESTVVTYRKALEIFGTLSEAAMGRGVTAQLAPTPRPRTSSYQSGQPRLV
jgi:hypothetical protein